jgi:hypothetical protein
MRACWTRALAVLVLVVISSPSFAGNAVGQPRATPLKLTSEQAERVLVRLLDREPFYPKGFETSDPDTLNKFFTMDDYRVLMGNPFLGYWDSGAFAWSGGMRVAWDGLIAADGGSSMAAAVSPKAWEAALAMVAKGRGVTIDSKAPVRLKGACVHANLLASKDLGPAGVLVELRFDGPSGPLRLRLGAGKPSIEEAMAATLDRALGFALRLKQRSAPGSGK